MVSVITVTALQIAGCVIFGKTARQDVPWERITVIISQKARKRKARAKDVATALVPAFV